MATGKIQLEDSLADAAVSAKTAFQTKTRRVDTPTLTVGTEQIQMRIEALSPKTFRRLQDEHPARKNNVDDAPYNFNYDTFPPAFFAISIKEPDMTEEEWSEIWHSPDWTLGELSTLFDLCWGCSNRGIDVNFGGRG